MQTDYDVLAGKGYLLVIDGFSSMITYGNPIGVSTKITEDLIGTGNGPLGMNDLFFIPVLLKLIGAVF